MIFWSTRWGRRLQPTQLFAPYHYISVGIYFILCHSGMVAAPSIIPCALSQIRQSEKQRGDREIVSISIFIYIFFHISVSHIFSLSFSLSLSLSLKVQYALQTRCSFPYSQCNLAICKIVPWFTFKKMNAWLKWGTHPVYQAHHQKVFFFFNILQLNLLSWQNCSHKHQGTEASFIPIFDTYSATK